MKKWILNNEAPFDIWLQETEIEPTKKFICNMRFIEYRMWFLPKELSDEQKEIERQKYMECNLSKITFDDILNLTASIYGNYNSDRTITIIKYGVQIERWQKINS